MATVHTEVTAVIDARPIEKLSTPGFMKKLYTDELNNVQTYVKKNQAHGGGGFE